MSDQAELQTDDLGGFAPTYGVELLYEELPPLLKADLCAAIQRHSPETAPLDGHTDTGPLAFAHTAHLVHGAVPAQCMIVAAEKALPSAGMPRSLEQSWTWPEAKDVVARCHASMLVTDLLSSSLDYKDRLELLQKVLTAVLEVAPCLAMHWPRTQQYVRPEAFLEAAQAGTRRLLPGALNVRFYRITGYGNKPAPSEDIIMDTLGLGALGLTDLQCHFRGLEAKVVAPLLHNAACYVFDQGPASADGHMLPGLQPGEKWRCRHEDALVPPKRPVIDLDPGAPYAAGKRA